LEGGGECGARIRAFDWSRTALGAPESWPSALQTLVRVVLTSRQPMFVWWGPELLNLYNDAYRAILGGKHPDAIGQPAAITWAEIWPEIGPRAASAMRTNEGTFDASLLLLMERNGYREETYYTFSYSPVPLEAGRIGGIFCANIEETHRIVGERQLAVLRELAAALPDARTPGEAYRASVRSLTTNRRDIPFALLHHHVPSRGGFVLEGSVGLAEGHPLACPFVVSDAHTPWPLGAVTEAARARVVELDPPVAVPGGAWDAPCTRALLLPITSGARSGDVLTVAINPYRLLDDDYRGFLELVAHQVGAGVANARAYEEARERAEALAELDLSKTVFLGNVSHELRTPLTLILGPLQDALASPGRALSGAELEAAHRNAHRLLRLTNTLLDFSRFEAGRAETAFAPTELGALTADIASAFRSLVESAGLIYTVDCAPLPRLVQVDRLMWEKVVLNLLSNAFKHTFTGDITVSLRAEAESAVLRVTDTGVGIPAEHLPRLFDRFHRVPSSRARTHEGTGIGLALVEEVVRLHGGAIAVQSALEEGTTFTVSIPLGLPAEAIAAPRATEPSLDRGLYVGEAAGWVEVARGLVNAPLTKAGAADPAARVLLADDNADMRSYIARLLAPHWTVEAVADGEAALAAARARPPDLVLTDVMMPGLDGLGLLRALREDPATRAVPVILLSARAGEDARVEGIDTGADEYLVKPFGAAELVARVRSQLELARLRRAREREAVRLSETLEARVAARTEALRAQAAELRAVNDELSAFTYTIAHDLRAPLRTMHRFADTLAEEYGPTLDALGRSYADRIAVAARKMDDLIRGLLEYSRVARLPVSPGPFNFAHALADLTRMLPEEAAHLSVQGPFPCIVADRVLLLQVLANLLSNACKFVAPGVDPQVTLRAERHDGAVHLVLEDNGIGIAPEHLSRIFGVFERLHRPTEFEGTGIGLAIAARAAERMGGRICVRSEPGVGSTFVLVLPACEAAPRCGDSTAHPAQTTQP